MEDSTEPTHESFFETLLYEAVGPCFLSLDDAPDIVIDVPSVDDILEAADTTALADQLDLLAGPHIADQLLDLYENRPVGDLADLVDDIREHFGILIEPRIGWVDLIDEIDKYGDAIERDLMDIPTAPSLYDWVRDHRNTPWDKLIRILSKMPESGWYVAAVSDDFDRAEELLQLEDDGEIPKPSSSPPLIGWTKQVELLTEMVESLRKIEHATWGASPKFKGKGGKPPKALPRPRTARDRAKEIRSFRDHDEIGAQVLGSRYKPILA